MLQLGQTAPDFDAETTQGPIHFHEFQTRVENGDGNRRVIQEGIEWLALHWKHLFSNASGQANTVVNETFRTATDCVVSEKCASKPCRAAVLICT